MTASYDPIPADLTRFIGDWASKSGSTTAQVSLPAKLVLPGVACVALDPCAEGTLASDLVVLWGVLENARDWRKLLRTSGARARRLLLVVVQNPAVWRRAAAPLASNDDPRRTGALAPVLWEVGRVRDHVYLDVPSWPRRLPRVLIARLARLHAFAVDTLPRTPQQRRRLALLEDAEAPTPLADRVFPPSR